MSKKNALTPLEVYKTITDYLQALKLAKGEQEMEQTELTYRKGLFYLRPPGTPPERIIVPRKKKEIEAMTTELRKQIPQRGDSEEDSFE
jgi:hypothetical protein